MKPFNPFLLFQIFKDSYKFVDDIKSKEITELKNQLKDEEDPEEIERLKYLIQRMVIKIGISTFDYFH